MSGLFAVIVRLALAFAPAGFRREYGAHIRADTARAFAEERALHGTLGAGTYACEATADLLTTALREYVAMIFRDVRYALRTLRKTPTFSAVVIMTLALAIGANATVFSILRGVVLAPLPYVAQDRLVAIDGSLDGKPFALSLPEFSDLARGTADYFDDAAAFSRTTATLTGYGEPRKLDGVEATPGFFSTLGVVPLAGRFANANDAARGAAKTVAISERLYRTTFAANPQTVGSLVRLDGEAFRIVGVVPADFRQPRIGFGYMAADYWTVLPTDGTGTQYNRGYNDFMALARLRPHASLATANRALDAAVRVMRRRYPADDGRVGATAKPLIDSLVGKGRALLFALFAAVGAVVLVACANVANLLLGRAATREREFSVRIAIGASRERIIAQLLVETFVLAAAGGALGLGLAYAGVHAFLAAHPANVPRADSVTLDGAAMLYTFGIVAFCTLAAGLAPAFTSAERDVAHALKSAGRGGDGSRGARARNALVTCEIAFTLALVIAAGLVIRSYATLTAQPLGFDPTDVSIVGLIELPDSRYASEARQAAFHERALRRARAVPGVASAAWALNVPFTTYQISTDFTLAGHPVPPGHEPSVALAPVGGDFFTTLRASVRTGRGFTDADRLGSVPVAIVNASFARTYLGGRSPLGASITPGISSGTGRPPGRRIVGIVDDLRGGFARPLEPMIYIPDAQIGLGQAYLVIRAVAGTNPGPAVADAVASIDPLLPKPDVVPMRALLAENVAVQRLTVAALCALAFVALALSLAGVFAVVSYGVTQRTHEFGVRMALGADARGIIRIVIGGAMRLAVIGIALGLCVAGATTRLIADQLYDTQPFDPLTFAIVTVLVVIAALIAAIVPARRATRVDPIVALRYE